MIERRFRNSSTWIFGVMLAGCGASSATGNGASTAGGANEDASATGGSGAGGAAEPGVGGDAGQGVTSAGTTGTHPGTVNPTSRGGAGGSAGDGKGGTGGGSSGNGAFGAAGTGNVATSIIPAFPIFCTTASTAKSAGIGSSVLRLEVASATGPLVIHEGPAHADPSKDTERSSVQLPASVSAHELTIEAEGFALHASRNDADNAIYTGTIALPGGLGGSDTPSIVCWGSDFTPHFRYDAATGNCHDSTGKNGHNAIPLPMMRESKQAECTAPASVTLNEDDLGYPTLDGWRAAGADFSGSRLSFARLTNADLRGANLATLTYGYATITGTTDAHTLPPTDGCKTTVPMLECYK